MFDLAASASQGHHRAEWRKLVRLARQGRRQGLRVGARPRIARGATSPSRGVALTQPAPLAALPNARAAQRGCPNRPPRPDTTVPGWGRSVGALSPHRRCSERRPVTALRAATNPRDYDNLRLLAPGGKHGGNHGVMAGKCQGDDGVMSRCPCAASHGLRLHVQ